MSKIWAIKIKTRKVKTEAQTSSLNWWKKNLPRIRKAYAAQRIYLDDGSIVIHYVKKVGTYKVKRLDGVKP